MKMAAIGFKTRKSAFSRDAPEMNTTFYTEKTFRQVTSIASGVREAWPNVAPPPFWQPIEYGVHLPPYMVNRLFGYVANRLAGVGPPIGNCFECASYMTGNDETWVEATRRMNALLPLAQKLADNPSVRLGDIVLVGHPEHGLVGALEENGRRAEYRDEDGNDSPLYVHHACIAIGSLKNSGHEEAWALHRLAIGGALAIDPLSHILDVESSFASQVQRDCWVADDPPSPTDVHLYHVPSSLE